MKDVILIRDKFTNRSKGFSYVEMAALESIPLVLLLNGQPPDFQKFPIMVKASEAEKNFIARQESNAAAEAGASSSAAAAASTAAAANRLYVGNLHVNITEPDLSTVFAPFGEIQQLQVSYIIFGLIMS